MRLIAIILSVLSLNIFAEAQQLPPKPRSLENTIKAIKEPVSERLSSFFTQAQITMDDLGGLTLIYLKQEQILEVWANTKTENIFIKSYPLTATSGHIGPKYKEGDEQIPEGLYRLTHFNPNSLYHLSLGVNYPNEEDKKWAKADERNLNSLGGDIMLHGKNVTIGCIPIGDEGIEEVFYMVYKAGIGRSDIIMSPVDFRKISYQSPIPRENKRYDDIKRYMEEFRR